jgi:hypothetical protein
VRHNQRLEALLTRICELSAILSKTKCEFEIEEIIFVGDKSTAHGFSAADQNVRVVQEYRALQNAK